SLLFATHNALYIALIVIAAGSVVTCITRTRITARQLKEAQ
ncbi:MAG TPA: CDP-diacylglycerol--glycerol-3-phosphate 3-phosphatidyltransferase, partial [Pseudomonas sp.]|nr:CDP-diacylglycerol--glycerol-3-phosphate 3-phosphatidyltransferase [Pseudomonas sp.]